MNLLRFIAHFSITFFFSFVICAIEVVSFPTARRAYTRVEGGGQDFFLVFSKTFFRLTLPRFTRALQKLRFPAFHANLRHPTPPHHTSPTRVTRPFAVTRYSNIRGSPTHSLRLQFGLPFWIPHPAATAAGFEVLRRLQSTLPR